MSLHCIALQRMMSCNSKPSPAKTIAQCQSPMYQSGTAPPCGLRTGMGEGVGARKTPHDPLFSMSCTTLAHSPLVKRRRRNLPRPPPLPDEKTRRGRPKQHEHNHTLSLPRACAHATAIATATVSGAQQLKTSGAQEGGGAGGQHANSQEPLFPAWMHADRPRKWRHAADTPPPFQNTTTKAGPNTRPCPARPCAHTRARNWDVICRLCLIHTSLV